MQLPLSPGGWRLAGEMSDAAEVLDTLYSSLEAVAGKDAPVNAVFTLNVVEGVTCKTCSKTTHKQDNSPVGPSDPYTLYLHTMCRLERERESNAPVYEFVDASIECLLYSSTYELRVDCNTLYPLR